ncbi:MAG: hypothetical protein MRY74_12605 [Neomegalonema sp.]|nr:hypothetical protein [Neomegalonema sp.]
MMGRQLAIALTSVLLASGPAAAQTCFPIGKERAQVGRAFAYTAKVNQGQRREHQMVYAAVARSSHGGVIWCRYVKTPRGFTLFGISETDANGVIALDRTATLKSRVRKTVADLRRLRSVGKWRVADLAYTSRCVDGAHVLTTESVTDAKAPRLTVTTTYTKDGVIRLSQTKSGGSLMVELKLLGPIDWNKPSCLKAGG